MSTDKPPWDPAVDGVAELVEHRRQVKELRALATGWEKEAEKTYEAVDAMRGRDADTDARADVGEARAEECDAHARAIFAIVGRM